MIKQTELRRRFLTREGLEDIKKFVKDYERIGIDTSDVLPLFDESFRTEQLEPARIKEEDKYWILRGNLDLSNLKVPFSEEDWESGSKIEGPSLEWGLRRASRVYGWEWASDYPFLHFGASIIAIKSGRKLTYHTYYNSYDESFENYFSSNGVTLSPNVPLSPENLKSLVYPLYFFSRKESNTRSYTRIEYAVNFTLDYLGHLYFNKPRKKI